MSTIVNSILDCLQDDIVSHGLLVQCSEQEEACGDTPWEDVLTELLAREVEIGSAKNISGTYVEFVAWKGTIDDRVSRAIEAVSKAFVPDKEFAYWLCLRKNVDRYEQRSL